MDTKKIEKKNTKIIAHRGLSSIEVENTKEAFIAAANRSYFGIETDISVTKDDKIIIIHDVDLKRLANIDKEVINMTSDEILNLNLIHQNNYTISGNHSLYFEDYLAICKRYEKHPIVELKVGFNNESLKKVVKLLKKYDLYDNATIISFNHEYLKEIRKFDKKIKLQQLLADKFVISLSELKKYELSLDIYYKMINQELVDNLHSLGLEVNAWTVDEEIDAKKLIDMGIDYITSNILE